MNDEAPARGSLDVARGGVRLVLAVVIVASALSAVITILRGVRRASPTGARARAALLAGQTAEARRLAQNASDLTDGADKEALAVLDELDLTVVRGYPTPRQRAEAAVSVIPRTQLGRQNTERGFFEDAEQAVLADDGTTIEDIRFSIRTWPNAAAVDAQLIALRELVILQRCVKATKLVCAGFFPGAEGPHPAVESRIEGFRARQVVHAAKVFDESAALLKTKPDPTVAGAAQRDQVLAAAEHVALARPAERVEAIARYAKTHQVDAFHAAPPR